MVPGGLADTKSFEVVHHECLVYLPRGIEISATRATDTGDGKQGMCTMRMSKSRFYVHVAGKTKSRMAFGAHVRLQCFTVCVKC